MSRAAFAARRAELADIRVALDDATAGKGRIVLVQGPHGVGKTALVHETAREAGERGFTVVSARARRGHDGTASPLITAAAARRAPELADVHGVDELICALVSLAPVAVALDDAQHADEFSLRVVEEMAHRIRSRPVLLLVAVATHPLNARARQFVDALLEIDDTAKARLHGLGDQEAAELIRGVLPRASPKFCAECVELTGGIPFLLSELTAWIRANRLEPVAGAPKRALEPVPPLAIQEFAREQIEELGPDASALSTAMATADRPLRLESAAQVAGLDRNRGLQAAHALRESGMIVPDEPLMFAAPVVAHCLRASTPAALAADLHAGAVVDRLVELADGEVADGRPAEARALIRRALAEDGPGHPANPGLVARLGHVDLLEGRPASTPALAAAVAALESERERADALLKLGNSQLAADAPREAWFSFDAARALVSDDDPIRTQAEISSLIAKLFVPEAREAALAEIERLCQVPNVESAPHGADLLLTLAWQRLCRGAPSHEIARLATRALAARSASAPSINGFFATAAAILLATVDDFVRAHEVCDAYGAAAREQGSVLAERNIVLARAVVLLHQGHVGRACELAHSLLARDDTPQFFATEAAAVLASALHEQGSYADAEQIVARATLTSPAETPRRLLLLEVSARVALEHGRLADALRDVAESEALAKALGIANPAVVAWQPTAALCYKAVGQLRRAQTLAHEAVDVAESFGSPRLLALTLRTAADVEGPPAELEHLGRALGALDGCENELERAKVLVSYGSALHRAGRDDDARGFLREGIALADRLSARSISRPGFAMLRAAGGRPRRARMTGPEALTQAERQVVDLAAGGATNREIAETLVVVQKTVEWHLKKAFVKLGIRSRTELAGVMETK